MITYLYVKTHTITGLKYLGKTISKDPHKYKGSGTYWMRHLKIHGSTYTTEILKECEHQAMVEFWGQHYSDLWNIVESNEWANLKPETGDGGCISGLPKSDKTRKKLSDFNIGKKLSDETRKKMSASKTGHYTSAETKAKISAAKKGKPGKSTSFETRTKMAETQRQRWIKRKTESLDR